MVTHDADFGALAVHGGERIVRIVYVRPGHISPRFVIDVLASLDASPVVVEVPFIVVAERHGDQGDQASARLRGLHGVP